jgi:hypothetical protein
VPGRHHWNPVRAALLILPLHAACGPRLETATDVPVTAAWLEGLDLQSVVVLGGVVEGDALLGYTDDGGRTQAMPVHLGGGALGFIVDITADPEWGHDIPLDLTEAEVDPVMLSDLLGSYRGTAAGFALGIGIDGRDLQNRRGIKLEEDHFAFGVGIMAGYEWVKIREGGSEGAEVLDTAAVDTAAIGDSGDCDSGTCDTADSAGGDSGTEDSGGERHPPRDPPEDSGVAADEGESSGCCCAGSNGAMALGIWVFLGGLRRRRTPAG